MIGILLNIAWFTVCFLFFAAVVGSIALNAWRRREAERAAATQRVLDSLLQDNSHTHEQDIV